MSDLDIIKEIEKIIGEELKPCPADKDIMDERGTYQLNPNQKVVGLNLLNCDIENIDFLKKLKKLIRLNLGHNSLKDINDLKELINLNQLYLSARHINDIAALKELTSLTKLDLIFHEINDLIILKNLKNLNYLSLCGNKIHELTGLENLDKLTYLYLEVSEIKNIKPLGGLKNISELCIWGGNINDITIISELKEIKKLQIGENLIDDISALKDLKKITHLELWSNQITDISTLVGLDNLSYLSLSSNNITDISVLQRLHNISELDLSNNRIISINPIKNLKKLSFLNLGYMNLKVVPEWLLDFNLEIKWEYEGTIGEIGIVLGDNPLEEPPPEVIELGNEAIKLYFNAGKRRAINELKIILVGDGGAGKTSLSKVLRGELFDKAENQTHGININKQQINGITAHLWDFGGQEMMHSTHQFFLSKRSLYILVLDSREEDKAEYWLKYIESFGGNSPILVVLNKIDQHPSFDVNRKALQDKYQSIQGFYKLSCLNNDGLEAFKTDLIKAFAKVPLIRSKLPNTWFEVKTQLESLPAQKNFIDYQAYRELCEQQQISDSATQDVLSQYLNDLGVIIHFTDSQLMGTPVLKPRWITQAVYKIINFKPLAEAHGMFCLNDLSIVLEKKSDDDFYYPREKYNHIIELMKKFEICYEIDNQHILIPDLLEIQEPDFKFNDKNEEVLWFRIRYDFLPRSIMPRFIVKRHQDIKGELRWRTGVVLEDEKLAATAIVKVDYQDKLINIMVNGTQKRDYFAVIRKTFNEIHRSFEILGITELVPLPDYPQHEIEYQELIGYEKARKDDLFIGKLGKNYSVSTLLNGIEKLEDRRKEGDTYYIEKQEVTVGDKYDLKQAELNGSIVGKKNKITTAETKEDNLFKKPLLYVGFAGFIYFMAVAWEAYDLQQQGLLGNKTFKEIVLAPIPLLKTDEKK